MGTYQTDPDYLAFVAREETPATVRYYIIKLTVNL
jgi:hypothetical protein